jgi:hypothetical protein
MLKVKQTCMASTDNRIRFSLYVGGPACTLDVLLLPFISNNTYFYLHQCMFLTSDCMAYMLG